MKESGPAQLSPEKAPEFMKVFRVRHGDTEYKEQTLPGGVPEGEMDLTEAGQKQIAEVSASHIPGKNKKEQTINAYILTGIAKLITTGNTNFSDNESRDLCVRSGCYDSGNHATTMKNKGNYPGASKMT
jgi:hypothetical protein